MAYIGIAGRSSLHIPKKMGKPHIPGGYGLGR